MNLGVLFRHPPLGNLTVKQFLQELDYVPDDYKVVFENGNNPSKHVESYRGYYDDAELTGFVDSEKEEVTVKELRKTITLQLGTCMTGYKGGEYLIGPQTWLWAGRIRRCYGVRRSRSGVERRRSCDLDQRGR